MDTFYYRALILSLTFALPVFARIAYLLPAGRVGWREVRPHIALAGVSAIVVVAADLLLCEINGLTQRNFFELTTLLAIIVCLCHGLVGVEGGESQGSRRGRFFGFGVFLGTSCVILSGLLPLIGLAKLNQMSFNRASEVLSEPRFVVVPRYVAPALSQGEKRYQIYPQLCSIENSSGQQIVIEFTPDSQSELELMERCMGVVNAPNSTEFLLVEGIRLGEPEEIGPYLMYRAKSAQLRRTF